MTSEEQHETIEQRRSTLINDPNYAIVLSFLEKFRSTLDLPIYSFERLENHLLTVDQRSKKSETSTWWIRFVRFVLVPPRLIDFHFVLLKRLSLAKNTPREKFDSIITKVNRNRRQSKRISTNCFRFSSFRDSISTILNTWRPKDIYKPISK